MFAWSSKRQSSSAAGRESARESARVFARLITDFYLIQFKSILYLFQCFPIFDCNDFNVLVESIEMKWETGLKYANFIF